MNASEETWLQDFEDSLDPGHVDRSGIPVRILGYGEISTVFEVDGQPDLACKRMPLFKDRQEALAYISSYESYCGHLRGAGLQIPEDRTVILDGRSATVLYILQQKLPGNRFGHVLLHELEAADRTALLERIVGTIGKVWEFNARNAPDLQLAIDGQLSNWVLLEDDTLMYIDTSTPLMQLKGVEQLDPELFLQSAPSFLRTLIRTFFLEDVMTRYYEPHQVYTDLVANVYKEQRPDLVPGLIDQVNRVLPEDVAPLTRKAVDAYYREDKLIWRLFLSARRIDRWLTTTLWRREYPFILPGKIKR